MGLKNALFVSALHGNNLHSVWEIINLGIPPELVNQYQKILKSRRKRIKNFRRIFLQHASQFLAEFKRKTESKQEKQEEYFSQNEGFDAEFEKFMKNDPHVQKMLRKGKFVDEDYFLEKFDQINKDKVPKLFNIK